MLREPAMVRAGADPLWWASRWRSGLRRMACMEIHGRLSHRRRYYGLRLSGGVVRVEFRGPWWSWMIWVWSLRRVKCEVTGLVDRFGVDLKVEVIWSRG
jgi:hypothetical protein